MSHSGCNVCTGTHAIRESNLSAKGCRLPHEVAQWSSVFPHCAGFLMAVSKDDIVSQYKTPIPTF